MAWKPESTNGNHIRLKSDLKNFLLYVFGVMLVWCFLASVLRFQLVSSSVVSRETVFKNKFLKIGKSEAASGDQDTKTDPEGIERFASDIEVTSKSLKSKNRSNSLLIIKENEEKGFPLLSPRIFKKSQSDSKNKRASVEDDKVKHVLKVTDDQIDNDSPTSYVSRKIRKLERRKKNKNRAPKSFHLYRVDPIEIDPRSINESPVTQLPELTSVSHTSGPTNIQIDTTVTPDIPSTERPMNSEINSANKPVNLKSSDPTAHEHDNDEQIELNEANITPVPTGMFPTPETDEIGHPLGPADANNAFLFTDQNIFSPDEFWDPTTYANQFEGDIVNASADNMAYGINKRSGLVSNLKLWPNGVVPYVISSSYQLKDRSVIANAMVNFHGDTCIKFVPRTNERDYIHILRGDGCSSAVGRSGHAQQVSLGPGCLYVGVVMHELMHVLGFWHEQSRSDRDDYITIQWKNIQTGKDQNFQIHDNWNLEALGDHYDLDSLMHYSKYAFSKEFNSPTVEPKNTNTTVGQRIGLSQTDINRLNQLYGCFDSKANNFSTNVDQEAVTVASIDLPNLYNNCSDADTRCPGWARMGECSRNVGWMTINCRFSCNQCWCADLDHDCHKWIGAMCDVFEGYMTLFCKKTCGRCSL